MNFMEKHHFVNLPNLHFQISIDLQTTGVQLSLRESILSNESPTFAVQPRAQHDVQGVNHARRVTYCPKPLGCSGSCANKWDPMNMFSLTSGWIWTNHCTKITIDSVWWGGLYFFRYHVLPGFLLQLSWILVVLFSKFQEWPSNAGTSTRSPRWKPLQTTKNRSTSVQPMTRLEKSYTYILRKCIHRLGGVYSKPY